MNSPMLPPGVIDAVLSGGSTYLDAVMERMPAIMRIESLQRTLNPDGAIRNVAVLFHEKCSICVDWVSRQADNKLHRHGLASIRPAKTVRCNDGAIRVDRLLPVDRPIPSFNPFETVLHRWVKDRDLVRRAIALWEELPRPLAHLVTSVFWDSGRFHRFVLGPSSLQKHHTSWNGNFRHCIEVAEHARNLGGRSTLASVPQLITAGLLHDAAKADEYRYDRERRLFRMSDRGELVGHRDTLIEWLAVARVGGVIMQDEMYLSLLHIINASKAPDWVGLRNPRCIEAEILSMADRLSGSDDAYGKCAPGKGHGFGGYSALTGRRMFLTSRGGN